MISSSCSREYGIYAVLGILSLYVLGRTATVELFCEGNTILSQQPRFQGKDVRVSRCLDSQWNSRKIHQGFGQLESQCWDFER